MSPLAWIVGVNVFTEATVVLLRKHLAWSELHESLAALCSQFCKTIFLNILSYFYLKYNNVGFFLYSESKIYRERKGGWEGGDSQGETMRMIETSRLLSRKVNHIKGGEIRLASDFFIVTFNTSIQGSSICKFLKERMDGPRISYPAKVSFSCKASKQILFLNMKEFRERNTYELN